MRYEILRKIKRELYLTNAFCAGWEQVENFQSIGLPYRLKSQDCFSHICISMIVDILLATIIIVKSVFILWNLENISSMGMSKSRICVYRCYRLLGMPPFFLRVPTCLWVEDLGLPIGASCTLLVVGSSDLGVGGVLFLFATCPVLSGAYFCSKTSPVSIGFFPLL